LLSRVLRFARSAALSKLCVCDFSKMDPKTLLLKLSEIEDLRSHHAGNERLGCRASAVLTTFIAEMGR